MTGPVPVRGRTARHQQLPEEVASYVRERIISGEVKPGEFLRVEPIAEAVGVSNTPVREGLLALRSEGFVELVPRRGFTVVSFTRQDIRDLFWVQAQLAGELAGRAAKNITREQLAGLEAHVEDYGKAVAVRDEERIANAGHLFHRQVNIAAESRRLALLLGGVVSQLPNRFYARFEGRTAHTHQAHARILDAIRTRSARKAQSLMAEHMLEGADVLIDLLEQRGVWSQETSA
ncbi:GntR family transcriptional regulator [Amycolatopsis sp. K13G38]|uniref:GntR family transcriptional regulator n=1 Tax=Amycolatopsis acididurans TaxID=2724524 RepID=A0ABX1J717_9PSEU|nr:GntR family transcriptional regulator [Amycolatopsis acididurans]NKQ55538.1 GntR family transcriptional regulator [Amycolatopsis acididurans]